MGRADESGWSGRWGRQRRGLRQGGEAGGV